jgi:hypothetical protein
VWLLAALCAAPAARAQGVIDWSSERRLSKDDFKGRAPAAARNTAQSWLNVDASWECKGDVLIATVRATFDPGRSWWRAAQGNIWEGGERNGGVSRTHIDARRSVIQRDMQLLEHEQLHFDLTEMAVRRIRSRLEDLKDSCADPGGTEGLQDEITRIDRDLQDEQRQYDRDTSYGTNAVAQDRWKRTIRQQLDLLPRPQTPAPPRRR